ncbi:hypothetical protein BaRGS_00007729 [Batillaria attramentaria]|uniref:Uncharacterized protein n=1 Tax=Batillaria attramentaria TaxID=370345 RepID=A0ABD0LN32_9CAEN
MWGANIQLHPRCHVMKYGSSTAHKVCEAHNVGVETTLSHSEASTASQGGSRPHDPSGSKRQHNLIQGPTQYQNAVHRVSLSVRPNSSSWVL